MEGESFSGMGNGGGGGGGGHHQNRMLISEINQNHESRAPDSLTRNVGLIRELNNNIRRVVGLYADLSASFAHRGAAMDGGSSEGDSSGTLRSSDAAGRAAAAAGQKRVRPG
ncbi:hypothetical protein CFC21_052251 [Triticum aestivum]|uniref:Protein EARLY FLOWERING 4 domain-containing protein n=3 Tax=Triticum TaxID=4564 RepID=A0A9R0S9G3_TRITD|nr:hypothetical protein CFC21_052251 [Triticum aestivum]VAH91197.1 unnamed protein product [Triticum turgidum subsp. durum]